MFDQQACLERINYQGDLTPTLDTLRALQLAYVHTVPFENLDIHLGRAIILSEDAFYEKIVRQGRGGFCYESNTLFHTLLKSLGFDVHYVAAAMQLETSMGADFEHMALLVHLDGDYLVDVGNGQSCLAALKIGGDEIVRFEDIDYRVDTFKNRYALFIRPNDDEWQPRYSFTTQPRHLSEYTEMCQKIQYSETSHFTQKKVVTIARPDGRIVLADRELEIHENGKLRKITIADNQDYEQALAEYFGIRLEAIPESW